MSGPRNLSNIQKMVLHIFIQSILNTGDIQKMPTGAVTQEPAILLGGRQYLLGRQWQR